VQVTHAITAGASVSVKGILTDTTATQPLSQATVALQAKPAGASSFSTVGTAQTDGLGRMSVKVKPQVSTTYRWRYAGDTTYNPQDAAATSATADVVVHPVVKAKLAHSKVARHAKAQVYGTATASPAGSKVSLQEQTAHGWRTVATGTIRHQRMPDGSAAVGFVLTDHPSAAGTLHLRVMEPASDAHGSGTSATLTLKVTS
jgi:hypothetical protein